VGEAVGGAVTGGRGTTTYTVACATLPSASTTSYVKLSVPVKPGSGTYVTVPSALITAVPCEGRPIRVRVTGRPSCPVSGSPMTTDRPSSTVACLWGTVGGTPTRIWIAAPVRWPASSVAR
jgi:hypothetical protein